MGTAWRWIVIAHFAVALAAGLPVHLALEHGTGPAPWAGETAHPCGSACDHGDQHHDDSNGHVHCASEHLTGSPGQVGPEVLLVIACLYHVQDDEHTASCARAVAPAHPPTPPPQLDSISRRGPPAC